MRRSDINTKWFLERLKKADRSARGLARHLEMDPSALSRMLNGERRMKADEAVGIASYLGVSVDEVMRHGGRVVEKVETSSRIVLAAIINDEGMVERLKESRPLSQPITVRALAAVAKYNGRILAGQVRATKGPFAIWDDAVFLFQDAAVIDPACVGALAIVEIEEGMQQILRVEALRKTGEATLRLPNGDLRSASIEAATPILAVIP